MSERLKKLILVAAFIFSSQPVWAASAARPCEAEMARASKRHNVPLAVLYAVGLTESGRQGSLQPFAMNIEGRAVHSATRQDALAKFAEARQTGAKLIDVGCMQVNYHFHGRHFASVAAMFDPALNVDYAARFLRLLHAREGGWTMAVARYHAGPANHAAHKVYICRVIDNMIASGFGARTPHAMAYCASPPSSSSWTPLKDTR